MSLINSITLVNLNFVLNIKKFVLQSYAVTQNFIVLIYLSRDFSVGRCLLPVVNYFWTAIFIMKATSKSRCVTH